jgi:serine/threonine protein kinase
MINALLNLNAENSGGKMMKLRTWPWGKLGKRLGSTRSADGVVIDLPDARSANGGNVVAKFIFTQLTSELKRAQQEYVIGNMMSKAGVGPKVFDYYEMNIPFTVNLENMMKKSSGSNSVNLFQENTNPKYFKKCIVIIMENLYKGPGVVDAYTLYEGYTQKKPIPFDDIRKLIDKMHDLGVIHADMHQDNIMVQKIKKEKGLGYKYRPLIIDFGRSLKTNMSFKTNANANAYAKMNRYQNGMWWYSNKLGDMPVLLNGNAWMRAIQMKKGPGFFTKIRERFRKK